MRLKVMWLGLLLMQVCFAWVIYLYGDRVRKK